MLNFVQLAFRDDCVNIVLPRTNYPFPCPPSLMRANAWTESAKFCSIATTVLLSFFVQTIPFLCPLFLLPTHLGSSRLLRVLYKQIAKRLCTSQSSLSSVPRLLLCLVLQVRGAQALRAGSPDRQTHRLRDFKALPLSTEGEQIN